MVTIPVNKRSRKERNKYHREWYLKHRRVLLDRAREKRVGVNADRIRSQRRVSYYKTRNVLTQRKRRLEKHVLRNCEICNQTILGTKALRYCVDCRSVGYRIAARARYHRLNKLEFKRGPDWDLQKYRAMARDGHKCVRCGSNRRLRVHHKIPYKFTQDNSLVNLETLCNSHHSGCKVHWAKTYKECIDIIGRLNA